MHCIVVKNETLRWGAFRTGSVAITDDMPPQAEMLPELFETLGGEIPHIPDIYDRAIHVFLNMARN